MGVVEVLILLVVIIVGFYLIKKQEHTEYINKVKENKEFELGCVRYGNKSILNKVGEEQFIQYFGRDQLNQIKSGTDTKIVESIK